MPGTHRSALRKINTVNNASSSSQVAGQEQSPPNALAEILAFLPIHSSPTVSNPFVERSGGHN